MAPSMQIIASMTISILWAATITLAVPAISPDCSSILPGVMPCLTFVQTGSKQTDPGKMCCTGVGTVMTKTPQCLCTIITNARSFKTPIDMHRLLDLPKLCSIDIPIPVCDESSSPKPSPNQPPSNASPKNGPSKPLPPSAAKSKQNSTSAAAEFGGRYMAAAGLVATVFLSAFV